MQGGSCPSPYFASVARASSAPTKRTRLSPPPIRPTISAALSSPKVTRRPGLSLPPGCPIAIQLPSGSSRTSSSSAIFAISRFPCSLAGMTRDTLRTSTSSGATRSTKSGKRACRTPLPARSNTNSRLPVRSGSGSWAISSGGRSYSKSEVRYMRMRNVECGMRNGRAGVDSAFRTPHSALALKHRRLFSAPGRRESEMSVRGSRGAPAAWRAREEALLHEERLVHFLERARILTHGGGDGGEPDRSTLELLDDGLQDPAVHVVEPELVHVEPLQRLGGDRRRDLAAGAHLGVIAHALQEPVRDARRAAAAAGDLGDARGVGRPVEDAGRATDDLGEVVGRIVGEPLDQTEPCAHGWRQEAEPGGGADQREPLQRHGDRLRVRPVGDPDVHPVVLHRRIEELFEHGP